MVGGFLFGVTNICLLMNIVVSLTCTVYLHWACIAAEWGILAIFLV